MKEAFQEGYTLNMIQIEYILDIIELPMNLIRVSFIGRWLVLSYFKGSLMIELLGTVVHPLLIYWEAAWYFVYDIQTDGSKWTHVIYIFWIMRKNHAMETTITFRHTGLWLALLATASQTPSSPSNLTY